MSDFRRVKRVMAALTVGLAAFAFSGVQVSAASAAENERSYTYNQAGTPVYTPDTYNYKGAVDLTDGTLSAASPQDLFVAQTGELFIADTDNNRILIFDKDFQFERAVLRITDENGQVSLLNKPEGIYVYPDGDLLISDTQNNRLVRCDREGNAKAIFGRPDLAGVSQDDAFLPIKAVCDSLGRIDVVARNIHYGIVQLDADGTFLSYIGAPKVQPDPFTLFWRQFSTKEQEKQMLQFISTEYSNLYIDEKDFMWGTIKTLDNDALLNAVASRDKSGGVTPIKKLNSMGKDILKRNGTFAPLGDLKVASSGTDTAPSRIIDVALRGDGAVYSLLDITRGHIFTYDSNGNLLYIFGGYGLRKSNFQIPTAFSYIGDDLAVLDAGLGKILLFTPTAYVKLLFQAVDLQYNGDFTEANALWSRIAAENTNFDYAFVGLGKAEMNGGQYAEAMESFKYADSVSNYSNAFTLLRTQKMKVYFPIVFGVILAGIASVILYSRVKRLVKRLRKRSAGGGIADGS
ncbi:MAG: hypothetical protein LBQ48_03920 [Oscillospiraceae bacterium]|jgi:tetratricopeptide (TPR) repeat protein|nr:hypothetical protein [Oscillospiraceae bacterium]